MTITRSDLIAKMQADIPGLRVAPTHPPKRVGDMTDPDRECPICSGTGWSWAYRYERFMICSCTIPKRDGDTYRAPYGGDQ